MSRRLWPVVFPWFLAGGSLWLGLLCARCADAPAGSAPVAGEYATEAWRMQEGLLDNTVNVLLQSRDGYIYVGTAAAWPASTV
jgi:hypothetical protein